MSKYKCVDESQISFLHILEADDVTYVAKYEESYDFRFSSKVAYEMIRDSLYVMTFNRSNLQQRVDEITWFLSDINQEHMTSFTNCCRVSGLDPFETRMNVLYRWKEELESKKIILQSPNHRLYNFTKQYIDGEIAGYEKYKKAFYHIYPHEAVNRKCS